MSSVQVQLKITSGCEVNDSKVEIQMTGLAKTCIWESYSKQMGTTNTSVALNYLGKKKDDKS